MRERDVKGSFLPALGLGNVKDPALEVDMFDSRVLQRVGSTARQKQEEVEFSANRVFQSPKIGDPGRKFGQPQRGIAALLGVLINRDRRVFSG